MKKGLGITLAIIGAAGLIFGIIMLFQGGFTESYSWISTILGGIFFSSGMGLLKSTGSSQSSEG